MKNKLIFLSALLFLCSLSLINASLTDGLVSYYKLDEANGSIVGLDSVNGLNLNYIGSPSLNVSGKIGTAMLTNGDNQVGANYSDIGYGITGTNNFTLSFWFNVTNIDTDEYMVTLGDDAGTTRAVRVSDSGGNKISYRGITCGDYGYEPILENQWYHAVLLHNQTGSTVYLNGSSNVAFFCGDTGDMTNNAHLRLSLWFGAGTVGLKGELDEVGLWNRTLS